MIEPDRVAATIAAPRDANTMDAPGRSRARALAHWAIPIVVIGALFAPMVLTDRSFWVDNSNHLWLIGQRQHDFGGWPSYFVSSDKTGLFYPVFAFYGGPVYTAFAGLAVLFGHRPLVADRVSWLLPFVMAYGGLTWLSLQVGLRGWRAQASGLVFVSSAYYLTNIYGRGDWSEAIATSAVPLLVASGLWLVRSSRWRWQPMLAFAVAAIILSGSHNITLLWGTIFLTLVGIVVAWSFWPDVLRTIRPRQIGRVLVLGMISVGVNLLFLLPTVVWASGTYIGSSKHPFAFHVGTWFDSVFRAVFDPARYAPRASLTPSLYLQLPVFVFVWAGAFLSLVELRHRVVSRQIRRLVIGLSVIGAGLLVLMLWEEPWRHMPRVLTFIQFNLRLTSFEILVLAGLTMIGLKVLASHPIPYRNAWQVVLVVVLTYGFALGIWQVWTSESFLTKRSDALLPPGVAPTSWVDQSYRDVSAPIVKVPPGRDAFLDPSREQDGHFDELVGLPDGAAPIAINITAGPHLIDVHGVDVIGRTPERSPRMVIRRKPGNLIGAARIKIETASAAPITVGRWLSVASLSILVVWIVATGVTGTRAFRRARRRRSDVPPRPDRSHAEADSAGYTL